MKKIFLLIMLFPSLGIAARFGGLRSNDQVMMSTDSASTAYIQNTLTPTTTTQSFSVQQATVTDSLNVLGPDGVLYTDTLENSINGFGLSIQGLNGVNNGDPGDDINMIGGSCVGGNANGGGIVVTGGTPCGTGQAGGITFSAGVPINANGKSITFNASSGVGTNKNGGDISFTAGAATGAGLNGGYKFNGSAGGTGKLDFSALGSNRTMTFRDLSGTVAFLSDISGTTNYIQNTLSPTTTTQVFDVLTASASATISNSLSAPTPTASNHIGNTLTLNGGLGTGTANGGPIIFQTAPPNGGAIAAQMVAANSTRLTAIENANISINGDFTVAGWIYFDSVGVARGIIGKGNAGSATATNQEYSLSFHGASSTNALDLIVSNGTTSKTLISTNILTTASWYYVVAWGDTTAGTISIAVNDTDIESTTYADSATARGNGLTVGRQRNGFMDGRMQNFSLWNRVLTSSERTQLYNGSVGLNYADLTGSLLTGLEAWWPLNETSGSRADALGVTPLTDAISNTGSNVGHVTAAAASPGVLSERVRVTYDGLVAIGTTNPSAQFHVVTSSQNVIGQIIQGQSGQTSDLHDIKDGTGYILDSVNKGGNLKIQSTDNTTAQFQLYGAQGQSSGVQIFDIINSTSSGSHLLTVDKNGLVQIPNTLRTNNGLAGTSYVEMTSSGFTKVTGGTTLGSMAQGSTYGGSADLAFDGVAGRPMGIGKTSAVEIGTMTVTSAAFVPVIIQGASSQSGDLVDIKNSAATTLSLFDSAGNLRIGSGQTTGAISLGAQAPSTNFGINMDRFVVSPVAANIDGIGGSFAISGSAPSVTTLAGLSFNGRAHHTGGTITNVKGIEVLARVTNTGNVTNTYGAHILSNTTESTGQTTNNYGLYIQDETVGSNLNYSIYTSTGLVRFGDLVSVLVSSSTKLAKVGGTIFDHYVDSGTTGTSETDLYKDALSSNTFNRNGDKVTTTYAGTFVNSGTATRQLKVYFSTTTIFDSGAISVTAASEWTINVLMIRVSDSAVRCSVWMNLTGASTSAYDNYIQVGGLTFTNDNTLKITGTSAGVGAATNDIVASMATGEWKPAQ